MFPAASISTPMSAESRKKIGGNESRNKKISLKKSEWWASRKGLTVEQLFGKEKGEEIRRIKSLQTSGEKNPSFGKIPLRAGGRYLGWYKGIYFRSLLEYAFLKKRESDGESLSSDAFRAEPLRIPFLFEGTRRTYIPDFVDFQSRKIFEIKPRFLVENPLVSAKICAAQKFCKQNNFELVVVTEHDVAYPRRSTWMHDDDIVWVKRGN
jgi:hypothetical protein